MLSLKKKKKSECQKALYNVVLAKLRNKQNKQHIIVDLYMCHEAVFSP